MRSNDSEAFKAHLAEVYALYRVDLSTGMLDMWWHSLKPYNLSDVKEALSDHISNPAIGQFCPKPADVIKSIIDKQKQANLERCWNCQADITSSGWTALGSGHVCNPCYAGYLAGKWSPERAA